jgi:glycerophosphoryl diester phosphodiesterase
MQARPIVGHRGNAARAPENTIESFRQAVELGVDALELDVHLSADGQVVVIHDPTLDRTTDRSGRVDHLTLAGIQRADAGARFTADRGSTWPYRGRGITVPTFDDVLDTFSTTPLLIEIKAPAASRATREAIERHGAVDRCIVASFHEVAKDAFRGSGIARGASRRDTAGLLWRAALRVPVASVDFKAMCIPPKHRGVPLPVGGYARILAPLGVPVHVWTIDDPLDAERLRSRGVRGIISNDPGVMRQLRRR